MRGARYGGGRGGSPVRLTVKVPFAAAVCVMNAAGEIAWEQRGLCGGNASYGTSIIDAVYRMDQKMLEGRIRYEVR